MLLHAQGSFITVCNTIDYTDVLADSNKFRYIVADKLSGEVSLVEGSGVQILPSSTLIVGTLTKHPDGDFAQVDLIGGKVRDINKTTTSGASNKGTNFTIL